MLGVWCLEYLDGKGVDSFLGWLKMHADYALIIDACHEDDQHKGEELWLSTYQGIIGRHANYYKMKFDEHGLHTNQDLGQIFAEKTQDTI